MTVLLAGAVFARIRSLKRRANPIAYPDAKLRRDEARAAGVCINGRLHDAVVRAGKCARCLDVWRLSR